MSDTYEDNLAQEMGWASQLKQQQRASVVAGDQEDNTLNSDGGNDRLAGQLQAAKNRSRLAKYAGGKVAESLGGGNMMGADLKDQLLSGDFSGIADAAMTNPIVTREVWLTVIPSWGLTLFVLMFIWIYDFLHDGKLSFLQKFAIPLAFALYMTVIGSLLAILLIEVYAITHPVSTAWQVLKFFASHLTTPTN